MRSINFSFWFRQKKFEELTKKEYYFVVIWRYCLFQIILICVKNSISPDIGGIPRWKYRLIFALWQRRGRGDVFEARRAQEKRARDRDRRQWEKRAGFQAFVCAIIQKSFLPWHNSAMGADRIKKRSSAKVSDKIIFYSSRAIFSSVLNNNLNKYMKSQVQALPWRKSSFTSSSGDKEKPRAARSRGQKLLLLMVRARRGALSFLIHAARPEQLHTSALRHAHTYLLS